MSRHTLQPLVLAIVVSLPAFCAGHLFRTDQPELASHVGVCALFVVYIAAALSAPSPRQR